MAATIYKFENELSALQVKSPEAFAASATTTGVADSLKAMGNLLAPSKLSSSPR